MELEIKLPVNDREARKIIENNFLKIQEELNKLSAKEEKKSTSMDDIFNSFGKKE